MRTIKSFFAELEPYGLVLWMLTMVGTPLAFLNLTISSAIFAFILGIVSCAGCVQKWQNKNGQLHVSVATIIALVCIFIFYYFAVAIAWQTQALFYIVAATGPLNNLAYHYAKKYQILLPVSAPKK